jgi:hypothetical protein
MPLEYSYVSVICPQTGDVRKIPVALTDKAALVRNDCDFSNGVAPCKLCVSYVQRKITEDCSIVHKSHETPLFFLVDER